MKKKTILFLLAIFSNLNIMAQTSVNPIQLAFNEGEDLISVRGNLTNGIILNDLSWAWRSSVACFPENQAEYFTGNQVFYQLDLPSYTSFVITVTPDDRNANFSLYAYELGRLRPENMPPNIKRCVRCEADHYFERDWKNRPNDHTRTVKDILAIRNPYQVLIAVVGANGLSEGEFQLEIKSSPYRRPTRE